MTTTQETCWCCHSLMKFREIPFVGVTIHYCDVCDPFFDITEFVENYDFFN